MLEGTVTVTLGHEDFVLEPGDYIAFDSSSPHRMVNPPRIGWSIRRIVT